MGPFGGRALAAGDLLHVGHREARADRVTTVYPLTLPHGGARLRAMAGPHDAMFTAAARELFFSARFTVTPQSNRMGYRLEGPALVHAGSSDILSDATPLGSVQVPKSGQPILLMADRQTTGGYPKIATVISADIPVAGQLAPGDWIRFAPCTRREAVDALQRLERRLAGRTP
jgi:antagonist of KipI